jgi:hypothetical protein
MAEAEVSAGERSVEPGAAIRLIAATAGATVEREPRVAARAPDWAELRGVPRRIDPARELLLANQ